MKKLTIGLTGQTIGEIMDFASVVRTGKKYGIKNYELWPINVSSEGLG